MQFNEECVGIARNCLEKPGEFEFLQKVLADALEDSGHDRLSGIARAGGFSVHDLRKVVTGKGVTIEMLQSWTKRTSLKQDFEGKNNPVLNSKPFAPDSLIALLQVHLRAIPKTCTIVAVRSYVYGNPPQYSYNVYQDGSASSHGTWEGNVFYYTCLELADEAIKGMRENSPWLRWGNIVTTVGQFLIHVYGSEQAAADKFTNSEYGPTYHRDAESSAGD